MTDMVAQGLSLPGSFWWIYATSGRLASAVPEMIVWSVIYSRKVNRTIRTRLTQPLFCIHIQCLFGCKTGSLIYTEAISLRLSWKLKNKSHPRAIRENSLRPSSITLRAMRVSESQ